VVLTVDRCRLPRAEGRGRGGGPQALAWYISYGAHAHACMMMNMVNENKATQNLNLFTCYKSMHMRDTRCGELQHTSAGPPAPAPARPPLPR
jgi:hypothetical protein